MSEERPVVSKWLVDRIGEPVTKASIRRRVIRTTAAILLIVGSCAAYVTQPILTPAPAEVPARAAAETLRKDTYTLVEDFNPRTWRSEGQLDRAASWIEKRFREIGLAPELQDYTVDGRTVRNVVAFAGPADGPRIVIGAHYDACIPGVGADDNASGVAGVLELARLLHENAPPMRTDLCAFTLEEPPFFRTAKMGSAVYARALKEKNVEVRLMLSLEMIGYFRDEPGSQSYPASALLRPLYPSRGNFIAIVGAFGDGLLVRRAKSAMSAATALSVRSVNGPRNLVGIDLSDHRSFWDAGYPALMITDTAFFRNTAYHTESDTPDRLDYRRMAAVVDGVFGIVRAFASGR